MLGTIVQITVLATLAYSALRVSAYVLAHVRLALSSLASEVKHWLTPVFAACEYLHKHMPYNRLKTAVSGQIDLSRGETMNYLDKYQQYAHIAGLTEDVNPFEFWASIAYHNGKTSPVDVFGYPFGGKTLVVNSMGKIARFVESENPDASESEIREHTFDVYQKLAEWWNDIPGTVSDKQSHLHGIVGGKSAWYTNDKLRNLLAEAGTRADIASSANAHATMRTKIRDFEPEESQTKNAPRWRGTVTIPTTANGINATYKKTLETSGEHVFTINLDDKDKASSLRPETGTVLTASNGAQVKVTRTPYKTQIVTAEVFNTETPTSAQTTTNPDETKRLADEDIKRIAEQLFSMMSKS